jgi:Cupredoxin-like domain
MKSFTSIIKNMAGLSYIIMITMFIFSAITFSGLHAVTATGEEDSNVIQLGIVEQQEEVYRWSNDSGAINPTLKFIVNRDNIVKIQNPTDEEHEMIVQSQPGNELAASQDIEPNSSGELSFRPNITGTFQYHCEYHPTTMRGIIEVIDE